MTLDQVLAAYDIRLGKSRRYQPNPDYVVRSGTALGIPCRAYIKPGWCGIWIAKGNSDNVIFQGEYIFFARQQGNSWEMIENHIVHAIRGAR